MARDSEQQSDAKRLEQLWSGEFGNAYLERNSAAGESRGPFWHDILTQFPARRALEVGCNLGGNLGWIAKTLLPGDVFGIDINANAVARLHESLPGVNAITGPARELPFRDRWFDLVFTMGVLIHQPPEMLPLVMSEIVRCSRRFVLCGEYFSETPTEVSYRGQEGALYKRDFGKMYQELFPDLVLRTKGFLSKDQGWDDITFCVFEKLF
jgi:pseudaminic acid biosynthesis-associated methylase